MSEYYTIRKKYLAEALAFLGLNYMKYGTGKETIYSFKDTENFRIALTELTQLKNRINQY